MRISDFGIRSAESRKLSKQQRIASNSFHPFHYYPTSFLFYHVNKGLPEAAVETRLWHTEFTGFRRRIFSGT